MCIACADLERGFLRLVEIDPEKAVAWAEGKIDELRRAKGKGSER